MNLGHTHIQTTAVVLRRTESVIAASPAQTPSAMGPSLLLPWRRQGGWCRGHSTAPLHARVGPSLSAWPRACAHPLHKQARGSSAPGTAAPGPPHQSRTDRWSQWRAETQVPAPQTAIPVTGANPLHVATAVSPLVHLVPPRAGGRCCRDSRYFFSPGRWLASHLPAPGNSGPAQPLAAPQWAPPPSV